MEGDYNGQAQRPIYNISIHSLRVEGDGGDAKVATLLIYFNPLPPCGGRRPTTAGGKQGAHFNPLPPCGGRRRCQWYPSSCHRFQSTPSVWRETKTAGIHGHTVVISIHSLRVEGDRKLLVPSDTLDISIHSLRVEGDTSSKKPLTCYKKFQSTPSVWRETRRACPG